MIGFLARLETGWFDLHGERPEVEALLGGQALVRVTCEPVLQEFDPELPPFPWPGGVLLLLSGFRGPLQLRMSHTLRSL